MSDNVIGPVGKYVVCVMTPCCEKTEPDYQPMPKPFYVRTPGWSDTCNHTDKRHPVITEYDNREAAESAAAVLRGWYKLDGWMYQGPMPEQFVYTRGVAGSSLRGHYYADRGDMPFPSVEFAVQYMENHRGVLYNIESADGITLHSSFRAMLGVQHLTGESA